MGSTSGVRVVVLGMALAALVAAGGCMFVDAQFTMAPDGSTTARLEAGVLKSMAEQGEGDLTTDLGQALAAGKWREEAAFERGPWQVQAWVGEAGPGESLFAEGAEPQPAFAMTRHLLSTVCQFSMPVPEQVMETKATVEGTAAAEGEARAEGEEWAEGGEVQVEGLEGMGEAVGEMMAMMMSSGESGLSFSVELPGEIVRTNGEEIAPSRVAWKIDLTTEQMPYEELSAQSRLVNWPGVGRLGGALTEIGRWQMVPALIAGVRRGVVPDPVVEGSEEGELDAALYAQILDIMVALDGAVGTQLADEIMLELGLNADAPDPARVAQIAERVLADDFAAGIDSGVRQRLLDQLGG